MCIIYFMIQKGPRFQWNKQYQNFAYYCIQNCIKATLLDCSIVVSNTLCTLTPMESARKARFSWTAVSQQCLCHKEQHRKQLQTCLWSWNFTKSCNYMGQKWFLVWTLYNIQVCSLHYVFLQDNCSSQCTECIMLS